MDNLTIIISVASFMFTILSAVVGHIFSQLQRLKDSVNVANSVNDSQKEKINYNEHALNEVKIELKEQRDRADNKTEEILAMISNQENTLNNFITETRLHRQRLEDLLNAK